MSYDYNYRDSFWEADAAARGLVYDPYTGRYVEPWEAYGSAEEAVAGGGALAILAALELVWGLVVGIILLVSHIVLKIFEWNDARLEYKRLHEKKEPLGYQYDASLKKWGDGVRERYVLTDEGLVRADEYREPEKSGPRRIVFAKRCRMVMTPRGLVPAETAEREGISGSIRKAGGVVQTPVRGKWEFGGI
ncbi:hypothetical protein [Desulfofundulus salinus]|uniref:Uncharacterized protein n=1 Tax=Desulfofundulus salinus TaxID=2419843 RepID=A0A494WS83_9FIRM|nr:hypothetical protein [Desulfofundulus salinum]RKO65691.1 hypothetical protein D7024_01045 [Desulfofundulus salinum]